MWKAGVLTKTLLNPAAKEVQMSTPANYDEDEDQGEVFLDENDIVREIKFDDEGADGDHSPSPFSVFQIFCPFPV